MWQITRGFENSGMAGGGLGGLVMPRFNEIRRRVTDIPGMQIEVREPEGGPPTGKDIQVVSIDGEKDGLQAVADGDLYATVECSPRFGPLAFQTLTDFYSGKGVPTTVIIADHHFTHANAAAALKNGDVY